MKVRIGAEGLKASHSITQIVEVVEPNDKDAHLARVLKKYLGNQKETPRTLVFALYKKSARGCTKTCGGKTGDARASTAT